MENKDSTVPPSDQPPEYSAHFQNPFTSENPNLANYPGGYPTTQGYPQTTQAQPYSTSQDIVTTFSERPVIFQQLGPAPDSLVISIISIFFCLPFGIVATVKAAEARSRNEACDYIGAHHASKTARQFAGGAIGFAVGFIVIYFLIIMIA